MCQLNSFVFDQFLTNCNWFKAKDKWREPVIQRVRIKKTQTETLVKQTNIRKERELRRFSLKYKSWRESQLGRARLLQSLLAMSNWPPHLFCNQVKCFIRPPFYRTPSKHTIDHMHTIIPRMPHALLPVYLTVLSQYIHNNTKSNQIKSLARYCLLFLLHILILTILFRKCYCYCYGGDCDCDCDCCYYK